jgi:hypothetical protein
MSKIFKETNVIRISQLENIEPSPLLVEQVGGILTPERLLACDYFLPPRPIFLSQYPNFDSLLRSREEIRTLGLLPIKSEAVYQQYGQTPKNELDIQVEAILSGERLAVAENAFPYKLPRDLRQLLIWADDNVSILGITDFCARLMQSFGLGIDDVIAFERPRKVEAKLLRGTFPQKRHIHFWMRDMEAHL